MADIYDLSAKQVNNAPPSETFAKVRTKTNTGVVKGGKIFISASKLAALTGYHQYESISDALLLLFEKNFKAEYLVAKSGKKARNVEEVVSEVKEKTGIDLTERAKCDDKQTSDSVIQTQKQIMTEISDGIKSLPAHEREQVREYIRSQTSANYGIQSEARVAETEKTESSILQTKPDGKFTEFVRSNGYIIRTGGYADGIDAEHVLEIKNRMRTLFYTNGRRIRDYESVQAHIYMIVYDRKKTKLTEQYRCGDECKTNSITINYNAKFVSELKRRVRNLCVLIDRMRQNKKLQYRLFNDRGSDKEMLDRELYESVRGRCIDV